MAPETIAERVEPVIRLTGLTKDYGRHRALDGVDLEVRRGEVLGYLGPNGAGKTTTIRLLAGLLRPTAGSATVFGLDSWHDSVQIHRRLGFLPGEPALYERLTGADIIGYFASLREDQDSVQRARALAERFDLELDKPVRSLSRGNKQKLAIVQAFMTEPDLVLLDEPTSGLDPLVQQEFHVVLHEMTARGGTVLLSSHVLDEVQRIADRVGIIRAGKVVAVERLEDLRAKAMHRVEAQFEGPVDVQSFAAIDGVRDVTMRSGVLRCGVPKQSLDALVKALGRQRVVDVAIVEADLEEMFLTYYGEDRTHAA